MLLAQVLPRGDTKALAYAAIDGSGGSPLAGGGRRPELGRGVAAVLGDPLLLLESGVVAGFGPGMAAHFAAVREAAQRVAEAAESDQPVLGSWNAVGAFCRRRFGKVRDPALFMLLLDYRHRLLAEPMTFDPTGEPAAIARATVTMALRYAASGVIVVRLAPAGNFGETPGDQALARQLRDAGAPVAVLMHDYLVVLGEEFLSLRSMGLLEIAALYDAGEADDSDGGWYVVPESRLATLQETVLDGEASRLRDGELLSLLLRRACADDVRGGLADGLIAGSGSTAPASAQRGLPPVIEPLLGVRPQGYRI
jgi:DNA repair protein RadC